MNQVPVGPLATIETLKDMLDIVSDADDAILSHSLQSAHHWVCSRVMENHLLHPDVQQAELMLAARLYKRRQSPEGVAGWGELGVVRVIARDPDIVHLLEHHLDYRYSVKGIA